MNRNTEAHFSQLPTIDISRSKFDMSHTHKTTCNTGELIPIYVDLDIVPGDTVTMKMSSLIRMMTPLTPVMDNAFADVYFFFVPNRLVWSNFKKFMGENETAPWTQTQELQIPQVKFNTNGRHKESEETEYKQVYQVTKNSIANKMGIPIQNWQYADTTSANYKEVSVSQLPFRAYCLIWNEFFRDENLQNPVYVPKDNANITTPPNENSHSYRNFRDSAIVQYSYAGNLPPLKVCKPHDYFTSCLPQPQKGPAVNIPFSGQVPVEITNKGSLDSDNKRSWYDLGVFELTAQAYAADSGSHVVGDVKRAAMSCDADFKGDLYTTHATNDPLDSVEAFQFYTDMENAVGATINQLRQAFAIQKFYEREARGGTRYIESVWAHFRTRNPDFRLQRPEYLGGFRQNININQVVQNSPLVEGSTPLGTTGAFSLTTNTNGDVFSHSFTEHGILMGLMCIRTEHTYQQGINRDWFKKSRLDFYTPEFANLGEMAVLNQEIYVQGTSEDKEAFGYNEAWAEMRFKPSYVSGELSSLYSPSLESWTYADYYESKPTLGDKWIQETDANVARTLAIQNHDQFMMDLYFAPTYTRPLPLYSVPGLIDHH